MDAAVVTSEHELVLLAGPRRGRSPRAIVPWRLPPTPHRSQRLEFDGLGCRTWRVSSALVIDVEKIRDALSGDRFAQEPSLVFALAVHNFTRWPVDAWAGVRDEKGRLRTFYWIQGNTLGQLIAEGDENSLGIAGSVQLISRLGI
jgi:hypothetical protein